ncbi:heterodisulfide reductase-related iron-sulfur binding cluster [Myceligenerans pegani]|uniref:Glycolate oxidase iron-sulfur subunit n=1 Tax=Myceligenerans pegani TaxID=2776917 RepID=A0ABR9N675_9MICO|nr:heterodisulfide reductase-related iron-sulfur binding cluster [Myceligenerans sp. TRM 65318]MBE1878527.1 4Fe-4S dicluster domain-containing protein [Myceligenerans sp. TRM 65318]MBE3020798.1 4Fe-4S dicluster domain-containing protein [Myceligenerans sp. TRM 65318]
MTEAKPDLLGSFDPGRAGSSEGAFDGHHPPSRELVDDCVHCGFCLPACPTYTLWGEEMDSPRGRIHLMKQGLEGEPMSASMVGHIDACLGCMACVTACPSGVQYDKLVEATRAQVERRGSGHRTRGQRLVRAGIFALFPHPRRLRMVRPFLWLYQRSGLSRVVRPVLERISPSLAAMESVAPPLTPAEPVAPLTRAAGTRRVTVGLLLGCVQREFFPGVNAATVRVLTAEGCDVVAPPAQGCCGALSVHSGREAEGLAYARALVDAFSDAGVERVVVNSAGCGSTMKEYADLLADDPAYAGRAAEFAAKVRDVAEILDELGPVATRHPLPLTVAYHDACHLSHAQRVRSQPRRLLAAVPGLVVKEIAEGDLCCGSAGIYNLTNPEPARELGDRKAANVAATDAELLVTSNPGCLMQISAALGRQGRSIATAHMIQVLDASLRGARAESLTGRA